MPLVALAYEGSISVSLNGQKINMASDPVIDTKSNRVLVPFRGIFETLGLKVNWDATTRTITGTKQGTTIRLSIGSKTAIVNGNNVTLDVAPKIVNGATMVPLRFVAESSGLNVRWAQAWGQVTITDQEHEVYEDYENGSVYAYEESY